MLARPWGALLGLIAVGSLGFAVACGGSDDDPPKEVTSSGGAAGAAGAANESDCNSEATCEKYKTPADKKAVPPAVGSGPAPDGTADAVLAVSKLYIGDVTRDGTSDPNAWKTFGYDLDGYTSTATFGLHCKPQEGGKKKDIAVDGEGGIDNSFGKNIVGSVLSGLVQNPTDEVTKGILDGGFSIVARMEKLGAGADYTGVKTQIFACGGDQGADMKDIPPPSDTSKWGDYKWRPFPEALNGTDSKVKFDAAYTVGNTWVSGSKSDLSLQLSISGFALALTVKQAQMSATVSADRKTASKGTIGGILETEPLIESLKKIAGTLSSSFCDGGSAFDGIAQQIRQASDIMSDGTQDPAKTCNAISIGLGFDMVAAQLGEPLPPAAPSDPCAK